MSSSQTVNFKPLRNNLDEIEKTRATMQSFTDRFEKKLSTLEKKVQIKTSVLDRAEQELNRVELYIERFEKLLTDLEKTKQNTNEDRGTSIRQLKEIEKYQIDQDCETNRNAEEMRTLEQITKLLSEYWSKYEELDALAAHYRYFKPFPDEYDDNFDYEE
ncbi:hypothetical protein TVAG_499520 [Trichomonas vaginalis G3]|uniref:Uncharacterized protein n=1 Tax=Trichomonas vaginalis (strain ATCC PRA-98 / G3) TaxID=412133 RepID=A2EIN9_TRIV3|nr:hypothetical protein TVAGG3_0960070 [Trichomonas vaginalis G3]EAY07466.1 hypothetical protein TVAG_499520 [Trichomonas vaginalis G3]KAI5487838.1 hypothetical protein TVAGG3_0960070 [Trichomonas vaginalis G3]|eukprot:XP_001319689.1 hypothetical protein [Trichomonas vaginalis G3]